MEYVKQERTQAKAARDRANREYYYGRGLCPWCGGKRELVPGRRRCKECLIMDAERHRIKRDRDCRG